MNHTENKSCRNYKVIMEDMKLSVQQFKKQIKSHNYLKVTAKKTKCSKWVRNMLYFLLALCLGQEFSYNFKL